MIIKKMKNNIIVKIAIAMAVLIAIIIGLNQINVFAASNLTLTLNGDEEIHLYVGTEYQELGATAYDSVDGDVSSEILIDSSSVNVEEMGKYAVSYTITHGSNSVTKTRTVYVQTDFYQEYDAYYHYVNNTSPNRVNKVIELSDGGYLAVGNVGVLATTGTSGYNRTYAFVAKYDSNFNLKWRKMTGSLAGNSIYYDAYSYDAVEDSQGNYIINFQDSYNNWTYILIYD